MVSLTQLNEQRAKVGASQVVIPGRTVIPGQSAAPAAGTTTYDPKTRTISGPGAKAAETQSAVNRGGGANVYVAPTSDRAADKKNAAQEQTFRNATQGTPRPSATIQDIGPTGPYTDVEHAQMAQKDYYEKTGSNSPEIDAYIHNLQNRQRISQGIVQQEDIDAISRGKDFVSKSAAERAKDPTYIKQQLEAMGFPTDGTDPFAQLRDPNFNKSDYIARLYQSAGSWENAYKAFGDEMEKMKVYDQIVKGEYIDPAEQAKIDQADAAIKSLNETFTQRKAKLEEQMKRNLAAGNTQTYSKGSVTGQPDGTMIADSREAAVEHLLANGITDPGVIAEMLNFTDNGDQVGDFTPEEVQGIISGTAPTQGQQFQMTPTRSAIEAMIGRVTPEQAKFLQVALSMLNQQMAGEGKNYASAQEQADDEFKQFQGIASDMLARADAVQAIARQLAERQKADDEAAAAADKAKQLAANETERQMTALKLNEQKRQLELSNTRKINSMTNRLAIAGGFGSMGGVKAIEDAQTEGDQMVARFVNEIALTDQQYLDRAIAIDSAYTTAISNIHRAYGDQMLSYVTKYNDRVDEIQNLLFGSMQKRNEAITAARNRLQDQASKLQEKTLGYMQDAVKATSDKQDLIRKEQYQKEKDRWDNGMQYVTTYGTQNKEELARMEEQMGLPPGALSKYMTLAERRMLRYSGSGGTPASGQQTADYVSNLRTQILRGHPEFTGEQLDSAVLEATQNNYPGAKNDAFRRAVQNYVNDNNYDPYGGSFVWMGDGASSIDTKPYFVNYKFRPQFEQNVYQLDDETMGGLAALD